MREEEPCGLVEGASSGDAEHRPLAPFGRKRVGLEHWRLGCALLALRLYVLVVGEIDDEAFDHVADRAPPLGIERAAVDVELRQRERPKHHAAVKADEAPLLEDFLGLLSGFIGIARK